jgi:hypothetical protein
MRNDRFSKLPNSGKKGKALVFYPLNRYWLKRLIKLKRCLNRKVLLPVPVPDLPILMS